MACVGGSIERASLVALIVAGGRGISAIDVGASVPPATASAAVVCTHVGGSSRCPWDELHFSCSPSVLAVEYNISAYSGEVDCGSLFLESDIGGG